jgi:hypothetical protein
VFCEIIPALTDLALYPIYIKHYLVLFSSRNELNPATLSVTVYSTKNITLVFSCAELFRPISTRYPLPQIILITSQQGVT